VSNQSKFSTKAQRLKVQGMVTSNTEWFGIVTIGQAQGTHEENSALKEDRAPTSTATFLKTIEAALLAAFDQSARGRDRAIDL
jgi:hypothetical protein